MRITSRTSLRMMLGLALIVALVAACGEVTDPGAELTDDADPDTSDEGDDGDDDEDAPDDGPEGEPVPEDGELLVEAADDAEEIVFWTSHTRETDVAALQRIVETFNDANDDVQISMVQVPGDETDAAKLMTAVRGGVGPDIYLLDRFTAIERAAAGLLEPLGGHLSELGEEDFVEFAWQEAVYDGEPYALPFDTDTRALWYRADLLEEAGIDYSALDADSGPPTIAEVREISDQFDEEDDAGYTRVGFVPWMEQGWHYTWGYIHGGEFFDEDSCQVTPTDPGVVAGLEFMGEWAQGKGPAELQTFMDTYNPDDIPTPQMPIMQGRVAMMISGEWWVELIEQYAEDDMDFRVTYLPVVDEGDEPTTWSGGWSLVIPTDTENVENAVRALEFMAGPEGQEIYALDSSHLPTLLDLSDVFDDSGDEYLPFFLEQVDYSNNRAPLPVGVQYWDELTDAQEAVTLGQSEPTEALENVQNRVQQVLDDFCPIEF